jgi:hypothetical protein
MMCQGWEIPHVYGHSDIEPPLARKPTILGCLKALGFSCGSWSCQNGLRGVGAGSHGPGVVCQVAIAAISGLMPTMFMTRVRL